ncbi:alpha/beta hydrolase [Mycobacterium sp. SMC-17]|uniref:alpha/beta hydrolase n=1 Tax=Mycobacterium sp. SMC-17 TaxID=3381628 RepID=UPI00387679D0
MTISAVQASDPARLADGAAQLRGDVKQLDELIFDERRALHQLGEAWEGTAADAAKAKGDALVQQHEALKSRLTSMQSTLESAGTSLTTLRGTITGMVQQVFALGGTVSDDGTATSTGAGQTFTPELAAAYTSILKSLLQQFSAVDEATAAAIDSAGTGRNNIVGEPPAAPLDRELDSLKPPDGATDTEVNQWWDGLSKEERDRIIAERPDWIGNLDGVPGSARDLANRNRLAKLRNDPNLTEEEKGTLAAIDDALSKPDRQLLVVDFDGEHPKVAVALGNVDTAKHVSVYVPGTGSVTYDKKNAGNDLPTYIEQSEWLKRDTENVLRDAGKGDETVATVAWLGYEPPEDVGQAASAHYADDNAPKLASFINGLDSSRDTDPHLTVLGHSYGSTLASEALQRGTAADDAVFMGSPGLETNPLQFLHHTTPSDLHLSQGHVFVEHAKNDVVADLGRFGVTIPSNLPGLIDLSTNAETTPLGQRAESTGHSKYSFIGTTALYNQAVVVAGLGQDDHYVKRED